MTSYRQPGVVLTDRHFTVPLDHADPAGSRSSLYGREAVGERAGPTTICPGWSIWRADPASAPAASSAGRPGWGGRCEEFRVLLLDQRGTGRSTPANRQTLPLRGGPQAQADYLAHFRADTIVRDCELIRPQLTGGAPVDRARPELRRLLRDPLSLRRARRACGRPDHRWSALARRATRTTSTGPRTRGSSARSRPTTPAIRRTSSGPADRRAPR